MSKIVDFQRPKICYKKFNRNLKSIFIPSFYYSKKMEGKIKASKRILNKMNDINKTTQEITGKLIGHKIKVLPNEFFTKRDNYSKVYRTSGNNFHPIKFPINQLGYNIHQNVKHVVIPRNKMMYKELIAKEITKYLMANKNSKMQGIKRFLYELRPKKSLILKSENSIRLKSESYSNTNSIKLISLPESLSQKNRENPVKNSIKINSSAKERQAGPNIFQQPLLKKVPFILHNRFQRSWILKERLQTIKHKKI